MAERGGGVRGGGDVRGGGGAGGAAGVGAVPVEPGRGGGARVREGLRHAHGAPAAGRQLPGRRDVRGARVRGRQQGPDAAHLRRQAPRRVSGQPWCPRVRFSLATSPSHLFDSAQRLQFLVFMHGRVLSGRVLSDVRG